MQLLVGTLNLLIVLQPSFAHFQEERVEMTLQFSEVVSQEFFSLILPLNVDFFLLLLSKLAHALIDFILDQLFKARVQQELLYHLVCDSIRCVLNRIEDE